MTDTEKLLLKARTRLAVEHPFFASLVLRLELKPDRACPTGWSDGRVLGFSQSWIEGLRQEQIQGFLAHEVTHLAMTHHTRRGERDPVKWNVACDYAINGILIRTGFKLPDGYLHNLNFDGKSAEEIYTLIKYFPGDGEPPRNGAAGPGISLGRGRGQDPGRCGEVRDAPGLTGNQAGSPDASQEEQKWKIASMQAMRQARTMGSMPAELERLIEEKVEPRLDWRIILRRFVESSAKNDYSWLTPNRRHIHRNLYLPSLRSNELPAMVVAVDTSGSVSSSELGQFASELTSILEHYPTTLYVLYCDVDVRGVDIVTHEDLPVEFSFQGGGGTDFRPPFKWVEGEGVEPACLIYLTDLACDRFPEEPDYPVLWAQIGPVDNRPPFGALIRMDAI